MSLLKPISPCGSCPLCQDGKGFVPASGTGDNGVLLVGEAAGENEAIQGEGFVGKAGQYLFEQLQRVGIQREGFRIANVLSCRPPDNKLAKAPYEAEAIATCSPLLDATIVAHIKHCAQVNKTPVIVTLGRIAFKRVMGLTEKSSIMKEDYGGYVHWAERYGCYVLACDHPSYLMRGNHHLAIVLQWTVQWALDIVKDGFSYENPVYILDPEPAVFQQWVEDYKAALKADPDNIFLSYDIETPYKKGKAEDKLSAQEDESFTILRCSFAYREDQAISVPWTAEYLPILAELFSQNGVIFGWNSDEYDLPRVMAQLPVAGTPIDAMVAWHVLNSTLPKGLGFVTPFYGKRLRMWKHLNHEAPALYNAIDALAALRCWLGIREGLKSTDLWPVYERHVLLLNKALSYMSQQGLMRDEAFRDECELKLTAMLGDVSIKIAGVIPTEALQFKAYQKEPKDLAGLVQVGALKKVSQCPICGLTGVKSSHFKSIGPRRLKAGEQENPCVGRKSIRVGVKALLWAKPIPWKISLKGLLAYQKARGHLPIIDKKSKKITFDKNAMKRLMKSHPSDKLYPLIGRHHYLSKLLSTYTGRRQEDGRIKGGMPMGPDGLGHPTFRHDPDTLRLSCPFFHTLPRPGKPEDPHTWIRNTVIAKPGRLFAARDFSGIEAVLVGYEAKSPRYIRLARMDVHSYLTAHALCVLDGRVSANDLPDITWDDERLSKRLAEIKAEFKFDRNQLFKHMTHSINFGQGPVGAVEKIYKETDVLHPVSLVGKIMGIYKELFPEIPKWQASVRQEAHEKGFLANRFGYIRRYRHVLRWDVDEQKWKPGDEAEAAVAFKPQSNAAGIIKESVIRLYFDRFEEAGQYLRLIIHDENFAEPPSDQLDRVDRILKEEMEKPILQMPLPAEWGMGEYLQILTEPKSGARWGSMH